MARLNAAVWVAVLLSSSAASADPLDRWASEITRASIRFHLPEQWIRSVMRVESGGQAPIAGGPVVSRAGAIGLMQLMPGTWREMRLALGLGADPNDPADNVAAGAFYLRLMYDRFGYPGLFGAYNAGPARYAAWLAGARPLPSETRAYVAAVAGRPMIRSTIAGIAARARPRSAIAKVAPDRLFAVQAGVRAAPGRALSIEQARPAGLFVALSATSRP